jgi:SAM-dependent methyltransferase
MTNEAGQSAGAGHSYDAAFMEYARLSNSSSARAIIHLLLQHLPISSVLDVGCATGAWLKEWRTAGIAGLCGVDGAYVNRDDLQIAPSEFNVRDLSQSFNLGRVFDLVQSLEVAEHLPVASAEQFVASLARHAGGLILFSAAPPGQGGEFHINEQPFAYWRSLFQQHGYQPFDPIRPSIAGRRDISFWYRFNVLLYVRADRISALPPAIGSTKIEADAPIPDVSSYLFRVRKYLLSRLPSKAQHDLARLKARILPGWRI